MLVLFLQIRLIKLYSSKKIMKFLIASLIILLTALSAQAQKFSVNLFAGASNYQGDLQDKRYTFNQAHFAGGLGLSYDLNDHFTIRSGILLGKLSADDKLGRNKQRNLNFTSGLTEGHLGLQYYITPLADHALTPYVFAGVALYHFDPYTRDTSGTKYYLRPLSTEGQGFIEGKKNYNLTQMAIPFGAGVKLSLSENINVGLELGFRKSFTDYLDDVSTTYPDEALLLANRGPKAVELSSRGGELKTGIPYQSGDQRGSPKYKDMYYFTGLTLSFRLGNGTGGRGNSQYGCPVNVQ
jgi:hypothetical protein